MDYTVAHLDSPQRKYLDFELMVPGGEQAMAQYYLYLLNAAGHIKARATLTTANDTEAVTRAEAYLLEHTSTPAVELWLGGHRQVMLKQVAAA